MAAADEDIMEVSALSSLVDEDEAALAWMRKLF